MIYENYDGIKYMEENILPILSDVVLRGSVSHYHQLVLKQFEDKPVYWKPLAPETVEYKALQRKVGKAVKFSTPRQVLVDFGILRDSIAIRPGLNFARTSIPRGFKIGFFRGSTPSDRLKWAWQHEFGTRYLIGRRKWRPEKAKGIFKQISYNLIRIIRRGLQTLKVGKADIEGKMNIEKFINETRRLGIRKRRKLLGAVKVGPFKNIIIPSRSILRIMLRAYSFTYAKDVWTGLIMVARLSIIAHGAQII